MKKERDVRIVDIVKELYSKLIIICIFSVSIAVLFAGVKLFKNFSTRNNNVETVNSEDSMMLKKTRVYKAEYEGTKKYLDESILMTIDAFDVYANNSLYKIQGEKAFDLYGNLYEYISSNAWSKKINKMLPKEYSEAALSEIIKIDYNFDWNKAYLNSPYVERDSWYIGITFLGNSEEMVSDLQSAFTSVIYEYVDSLETSIDIEIVSNEVINYYDKELAEEKSDIYQLNRDYENIVAQLSRSLNEAEKASLNGQELVVEQKNIKEGVVKYLIFGLVAGVVLICSWITFRFVYSNKLKSSESLVNYNDLLLFGELNNENDETKIKSEIELFCRNHEIKNLYITSSIENIETIKNINQIKNMFKGIDISVAFGKSCIYDNEQTKKMADAEAVLLIESIGHSDERRIDELLDVSIIISANVIGVIVV